MAKRISSKGSGGLKSFFKLNYLKFGILLLFPPIAVLFSFLAGDVFGMPSQWINAILSPFSVIFQNPAIYCATANLDGLGIAGCMAMLGLVGTLSLAWYYFISCCIAYVIRLFKKPMKRR